jgi:hypothetical protein
MTSRHHPPARAARTWHIGDEIAAEARSERRQDLIASREEALAGLGRPVRLAEMRAAHDMTLGRMAGALSMTERDVTTLEAAGHRLRGLRGPAARRRHRKAVVAYLAALHLDLDGHFACYGDTRIPLA